ncbi:MAG: 4-(cytidine 5'-diphospho)-2-C-methyl-D-erythritol kinase [Deltaproteobacteria bacterium]|nr:4-(cytidine 5'-diphospho)-2-C-methyl-D-erythritol kinase [Deltaproteobacteria bacterium]
MKTQGPLRVETPAKITPFLHILAKRPDGYHEVCLALVAVDVYDTLLFQCDGKPGLRLDVVSSAPLGPIEENLVYQAAMAFYRAAKIPPSGRIRLEKRIPAGAGLGGGSGNAAATLLALNRLNGTPLSMGDLTSLAAELGSDVPFFLNPVPSLARGRGEILTPLQSFPALWLVIVRPPLAISTASAYRGITPEGPLTAPCPPPMATPQQVTAALFNRFEESLLAEFPELNEIKAALKTQGALGNLVSGSGSSVFGLFDGQKAQTLAVRGLNPLAQAKGWEVFPCRSLPG